MSKKQKNYLEYLSEIYPSIAKASTEIINLQSIVNLPKGTEHFMSDIHGEYEAFSHVLKNGSGAVRKKIDDVFGHTLNNADKRAVATLIYYPHEKLEQIKKDGQDTDDWYRVTLYRLIEICKTVSSKYTRSRVRKLLPKDYEYVIEELITEKSEVLDKGQYYEAIIQTIIEIGAAEGFIIALAQLIQTLVVDRLHIVGDIFDRGPYPHLIMDRLMDYHSLDIQWGNHDILWMAAAAGQPACVATVTRICLRYSNLDVLEDGYGINMMPLATFAMETYTDDMIPPSFYSRAKPAPEVSPAVLLERKMHKAIAVIQFKLEGQLSDEYPEFDMEDRKLLHKIDYENKQIEVDGVVYPMVECSFPTVDPENPYELTEKEKEVIDQLTWSFKNSEKLQRHILFMLKEGSLYKICNGNLLFHACIPVHEDGSFKSVKVFGKRYKGKELYDVLEKHVRRAFFDMDKEERRKGRDTMWFMWCAQGSPLFGKSKMATFEAYFIEDKAARKEIKDPFFSMLENHELADNILKEFGLEGERAHIINGHVPVHHGEGENPVKCGGKILTIDGGFSKAYQKTTGIAGYTLISNSYGLTLTSHEPLESAKAAILDEEDIVSRRIPVQQYSRRLLVGDTDNGKRILERIDELKELVEAYRKGQIKEKK